MFYTSKQVATILKVSHQRVCILAKKYEVRMFAGVYIFDDSNIAEFKKRNTKKGRPAEQDEMR